MTTQVLNLDQSKCLFLIETVNLIGKNFVSNDDITRDLNSIVDSIIHTAPEIIHKRWMDIYLYCSTHFTQIDNMQHFNAFNTYNKRFIQYKNKFI